jgi:hypothetical protein
VTDTLIQRTVEALEAASSYIQEFCPYDSVTVGGKRMDGWEFAAHLDQLALDLKGEL